MFELVAVIAGVLVALVLVGGFVVRRMFVAPEPIDDSRQYWS